MTELEQVRVGIIALTKSPLKVLPIANDALLALDRVAARLAELEAELAMWKPMTPKEAEKAFSEAEAVPLSEERIAEIVERATDPAARIPNSEQMQLAVKIGQLKAENARLRAAVAEHHGQKADDVLSAAKAVRDYYLCDERGPADAINDKSERLLDALSAAVAAWEGQP